MENCIKKILNDKHPECDKEGHRVHTTLTKNDEKWPEWSNGAIGIGGGFVHFECEEDKNEWYKAQYNNLNNLNSEKKNSNEDDDEIGRCVNECGPIGFYPQKMAS